MIAEKTLTLADVPSLRGMPFLGNLPDFRRNRLALLLRVAHECGDIGALRVGPATLVMLNSSELVQSMLVEQAGSLEKTQSLRFSTRPVLGNGLLTSESEFHRRQRKLIAPAFQHGRVGIYADTMAGFAEWMQGEWQDGQTVDVAHEMTRLTLAVVGKTLFDADVRGDAEELGKALTTAQRWATHEISALVHIPYEWPTPRNARAHEAVQRLDATIYRMIAERRASGEDRGDLLSMLLAAHDEDDGSFMTDRQVRDEAMTLFLAGHETTANALAWTWLLLGRHPEIYHRLQNEVTSVLGGRLPGAADLSRLPYTLQVFKEAMRLYPPAYMVGRAVVRPVEIGGYELPVGTILIASQYAIHRRPDYFTDPERFDPDRFRPERERLLPRFAYMPFGGGPRICIGNHFALMEGHIMLAALAQRVTLELIPGQHIQPEPLITLKPAQPIWMKVHRSQGI